MIYETLQLYPELESSIFEDMEWELRPTVCASCSRGHHARCATIGTYGIEICWCAHKK